MVFLPFYGEAEELLERLFNGDLPVSIFQINRDYPSSLGEDSMDLGDGGHFELGSRNTLVQGVRCRGLPFFGTEKSLPWKVRNLDSSIARAVSKSCRKDLIKGSDLWKKVLKRGGFPSHLQERPLFTILWKRESPVHMFLKDFRHYPTAVSVFPPCPGDGGLGLCYHWSGGGHGERAVQFPLNLCPEGPLASGP